MLHMLGLNPGQLSTQLARHKAAATWACTTAAGRTAILWFGVTNSRSTSRQTSLPAVDPSHPLVATTASMRPVRAVHCRAQQQLCRACKCGYCCVTSSSWQSLKVQAFAPGTQRSDGVLCSHAVLCCAHMLCCAVLCSHAVLCCACNCCAVSFMQARLTVTLSSGQPGAGDTATGCSGRQMKVCVLNSRNATRGYRRIQSK
jgi:hypothetical protein